MSETDMEVGTFESDGLKLSYRKFGKAGKTPIVLLHGLLYFSYDWTKVANGMATDREVIALDQRGFGDSDWSPTHQYQVADFARDVERLMNHRGWQQCIVAGHSMGGRNAVGAAIHYPDRIAGLVLLDSPPLNAPQGAHRVGDQVAGVPERFKTVDEALAYFPSTPWSDPFDPQRRKRFEAYIKPVRGGYVIKRDPHFTKLFFRLKARWPSHSYEYETWPMGQEFDVWEAWGKLACPTFIISGLEGDFTSPEMLRKIEQFAAEKNPNLEPVSLWAHHNIPGRNVEDTCLHLRRMCARIEG